MLSKHVAVRVDPAVVARIDALIPLLSRTWHKASRSEVLRKLIMSGLRELEQQAAAVVPRKARRSRRTPITRR